jgi:putative transposase
MGKYRKLAHAIYQCTYHLVWVPKYRYRILTGAIQELMDRDIRVLCEWKGVEVLELNVQADHVHLVASIPPKLSVRLHGISEREVGDQGVQELPEAASETVLGKSLLGAGVLRQHGGRQRGADPAVCPPSGGSGAARGARPAHL